MPRLVPLIADVRRNSLDDGPGIRSVVFFKGCPLRCRWCQNPETLSSRAEVQRDPDRCLDCGACVAACPDAVARPASAAEHPPGCRGCGACVPVCPADARRLVGRALTVAELFRQLSRDAPFYRRSGGGVTLSGGEPTLHVDYVAELAARLAAADIAVLLETAGHFGYQAVAQRLLPHVATVYFDLKLLDRERHRRATGRDNRRILDNLARLVERGTDLLVRVPLVPGVTDDDDNLAAIAAHVRALGLGRIALLGYNPLWEHKRHGLGAAEREPSYRHGSWMTEAEVARCRDVVRALGLEIHP